MYRRGCAPDVERHNDGRTALMLAAEGGHMQCCRLLIERGADPSLTENEVQRYYTVLVELVPAIIADLLSPQVHSSGSGDDLGAQGGCRFSR